jgi:hypothetical protein
MHHLCERLEAACKAEDRDGIAGLVRDGGAIWRQTQAAMESALARAQA